MEELDVAAIYGLVLEVLDVEAQHLVVVVHFLVAKDVWLVLIVFRADVFATTQL